MRECEVGILLSYPRCCVEQEQTRQLRYQQVFAMAIIGAVGEDPKAIVT